MKEFWSRFHEVFTIRHVRFVLCPKQSRMIVPMGMARTKCPRCGSMLKKVK